MHRHHDRDGCEESEELLSKLQRKIKSMRRRRRPLTDIRGTNGPKATAQLNAAQARLALYEKALSVCRTLARTAQRAPPRLRRTACELVEKCAAAALDSDSIAETTQNPNRLN
jgi:hypothetical protein